ncbi:hypothetical protein GWI33_007048 [Rhynchophorus ferrugineus]|uniref:Uncharacterized protein n=1 Tax=Rhynchophorus ferrugineus TaxID=354439 RepID=A0A834IGP8_RHYFE|nr:hypothetical protein GWI33_007048 [Rhynchophorus ferrugineus]
MAGGRRDVGDAPHPRSVSFLSSRRPPTDHSLSARRIERSVTTTHGFCTPSLSHHTYRARDIGAKAWTLRDYTKCGTTEKRATVVARKHPVVDVKGFGNRELQSLNLLHCHISYRTILDVQRLMFC